MAKEKEKKKEIEERKKSKEKSKNSVSSKELGNLTKFKLSNVNTSSVISKARQPPSFKYSM